MERLQHMLCRFNEIKLAPPDTGTMSFEGYGAVFGNIDAYGDVIEPGAFASYLVWMWMLGRYPATKISVFVFLTPLFALLFGTLGLGEAATPTLLAALALVAIGIVLVNKR